MSYQISICFSYKIVMDLMYLIRVLKCLSLITIDDLEDFSDDLQETMKHFLNR
mgnify:FL=1